MINFPKNLLFPLFSKGPPFQRLIICLVPGFVDEIYLEFVVNDFLRLISIIAKEDHIELGSSHYLPQN